MGIKYKYKMGFGSWLWDAVKVVATVVAAPVLATVAVVEVGINCVNGVVRICQGGSEATPSA